MKEVLFNGIGLKLFISNVAFTIFGINVYWYAILITISIILGIFIVYKDDGKYNIKFGSILELLVFLIPISFIGVRIFYVLFSLDYYFNNPLKMFNIRDGGLAIYGGIIAGFITIIVFCKIKKIKVLDMLDYIAPCLPLGQAIGRWGNFFNVEAYGRITNNFFRMGIFENGLYKEVHPTFLYESVITLLLFIFLFSIRKKRKYSGEITFLYLVIYSLARFFIEGLRTDSLMLGCVRISQILSLLVFVIASVLLIYKQKNMYIKANVNVKDIKCRSLLIIYIEIFLVCIGQMIKNLVVNSNIKYIKNIGIAFSTNIGYVLTILISLIIIIALIFLIIKNIKNIKLDFGIQLILAGGIGNFIDRIVRGYVVDYINLNIFNFPTFNLEDALIVCGTIYLIIQIIFTKNIKNQPKG